MKREKKLFYFILLVLLFINPIIAMAEDGENSEAEPEKKKTQSNYHTLGDNSFLGGIGLLFPLGFSDIEGNITDTNLEIGVLLSIGFDFYITSEFRVGARLSPTMAYTPNSNILYLVPLTIRATYEFQPIREISIPVFLGVGACFTSYSEDLLIDFVMRPGIGIYWNKDSTWSFGLEGSYLFIPQIWWDDSAFTRIGHFIELTASVKYNT